MIPNAVDVVEVQGNINADSTGEFTVDENSLAKIMGVLTNLYTDPEGAVVREYLTNALDAQIEAQVNDPAYVWRPIEVTLPSHFNKSYSVRDFGIGMSVDDIKTIYSKYGKSTKESSNDVTGMLGLGSKCALTYTNQFTIIGIKNGVKTKAIVSKNEADIPTFMIVDTRATDEPNGVEISVPVRDRNSFESKTRSFLRFWKDGQVLINGTEPAKHDFHEVKPGIFLIDNSSQYNAPTSYVVMGNVPYEVDSEYVDEALRASRLGYVAYVEMGAVDFPPSREKLMMTTRTKKVVADISTGLFDEIVKETFDNVESATSYSEAYALYSKIPPYFRNHKRYATLNYKGEKFPTYAMNAANMRLTWNYDGHGQIAARASISVNEIETEPLVVTGVEQNSKPTSYFKKKVKQYMLDKGYTATSAILVEHDIDIVWCESFPRVDADTIKAIKLPRTGQVGPRPEAPYNYYYLDVNGKVVIDSKVDIDIPIGYQLAYISPSDIRESYRVPGCSESDLIRWIGPNVVLVFLGKNRFEKFLRAYPNAVTAKKVYQQRMDSLVDSTTDAQFIVKSLNDNIRSFLKAVDPNDVDDPDLIDLIKVVANTNKSGMTDYETAVNMHANARRANLLVTLKEKKQSTINTVDVAGRYPLLDTFHYRRNNKHLIYYVNAVYQAEHASKP